MLQFASNVREKKIQDRIRTPNFGAKITIKNIYIYIGIMDNDSHKVLQLSINDKKNSSVFIYSSFSIKM